MNRPDHALVCALEALRIHQVHLAGRIAALEQHAADYEVSPATIEGSAKAGRNVQRAISQLRELPDEAKQGSWLSELRHLDSIRKSLNALFLMSLLLYAWVAIYPGLHHLHAEKPVCSTSVPQAVTP